jgi:glycine/D-amino acid oxidase-like deaminating enzyme
MRIYVPTQETFPRTADAVVVGGGVVGAATAFWLSREGLHTVVIERREALATLTTAASAECFRAQFAEPAMVALAKPSIEIFEHFADLVGIPDYDIALHQQGYLFLTDDEQQVDELRRTVEAYAHLGVNDVEYLDGDQVRARFPFAAPEVVAATFRQRDGWLSAHELTYGYAKGSQAHFLLRTQATSLAADAHGICGVETDHGAISTRVVVDAAGPFAARVARWAGLSLPIEPVRRQKVVIGPHPQIPREAPMTIDVVSGAYWRPEAAGALLGWVDPDEPVGEPSEDLLTDWEFPGLVLEKAARLTPMWSGVAQQIKSAEIHTSVGQYCYTPDDQPLLGPTPVPGFHLNCGYWAGVMLSPEAGRWVAEMITGKRDPRQNPLRLSRFEEGITAAGGSLLRGRH